MSRPVRDLASEDLGDLKAISSFTNNGKVYWNVTCIQGSAHVFSADELTRKRYPKRSCGVCGKQGYIDEAVYLGTAMKRFGWLLAIDRWRAGDIREFKNHCRALGFSKPSVPSKPFWYCMCGGRSRGHAECEGKVFRNTKELHNKTTGSCTLCRPHFLAWRAAEFKRNIEREERLQIPLTELDLKRRMEWTKRSFYEARSRVKRLPKYHQLGMYVDWKDADTAAALESFLTYLESTIRLCPHENYTLDRIDNTLGYYPGNVQWATKREQARNRSSCRFLEVDGQMMNLIDVAKSLGMKPSALSARLARNTADGMTERDALEIIRADRYAKQPCLGPHTVLL